MIMKILQSHTSDCVLADMERTTGSVEAATVKLLERSRNQTKETSSSANWIDIYCTCARIEHDTTTASAA